ncbi:hypothetical protein [Ferruginibacter sp. SUN106]|uniref:hypothetical protein n=1 Tax=Ferruginibacter sp. SUN106 TaxID=2978348 RepID=UPI003D368FFD
MRIFTLLLFLFCTTIAFAQKDSGAFLQQFKFRTPNYRAVLLSGNANGNITGGNNNNPLSFFLNPKLEATRIVSTDDVLAYYSYGVSVGYSYDKTNLATGVQRNSNFNYAITQAVTQKRYKGNKYFLTGYSSELRQSIYSSTNNYTLKDNVDFLSVGYAIGVGKGRIENVTDAQMAFNILNDLKKNNLLSGNFSNDDINGLAKTITRLNNTRLFDFRRKHIFELKQIDSFLNARRLVKEKSIDYFTTVSDNWFYAFNEQRKHGLEKFITFTPTVGINNRKTVFDLTPVDSTSKLSSKFIIPTLSIGIEKAKAISIKRQFNKALTLMTSYIYSKEKNSYNNIKDEFFGDNLVSSLYGYLEWSYYPNTRTNISTRLNNVVVWAISNEDLTNSSWLTFSGNYFVNYNTRVFVTAGGYLTVSGNLNADFNATASANFGFGIQHYIR